MFPRRIALSGWIGSGKSSIAERLQREEGYEILTFAYPLRLDYCDYFGIPYEETINPRTKNAHRNRLQIFGTDVCRDFDVDWWVRRFASVYEVFLGSDMPLVVDDVRFSNEAEFLRKQGFTLVRLSNTPERVFDYLVQVKGMSAYDAKNACLHSSEHDLDVFDFDVYVNVVGPARLTYSILRAIFDDEVPEKLYRRKQLLPAIVGSDDEVNSWLEYIHDQPEVIETLLTRSE